MDNFKTVNATDGKAFDWNDTIEHDSEFVLLPAGDYDFTVKSFERGRHPGSEKLPPCNKAVLTLEVTDGVGNSADIKCNLFLHEKCEGMLCAFFTSIGQRKSGEKLAMNWQTVPGSRGRCRVGVRDWKSKDGSTMQSNEIKRFLEPAAAPTFKAGEF